VPAWASDIVYYQIFPERFRNGNPGNDPQPGRDRYKDQGVERHKSWNERPFKPSSGDGSDGTFNNDFFGGDLAGITAKLDELADLGVNTLYLTPIFKAPSNHKYDTADFLNIDPAFGSNADFTRLTEQAARRGMRVIPDTSLNHVGSDSIYFNRFGNFPAGGAFDGGRINAASPYAGWFSFDGAQKDPDKQYRGWVGIADLPELDKSSPAWRRFAYGGKEAVTQLWLDRGAAGWRMDVAPWVPDDFWREWRRALKAHRPDAMTIAEAWFDSSKYLLGDMFDSTMNYVFRDAVLDFANGGKASALAENLELMREAYPRQALYAQMNLISSHDVPRALHVLGWQADPGLPAVSAAQIAAAKQRLLLAMLLQMTYPGAPMVYYGDEVGVTGGPDPYNRATYPWADLGGQPDLELRARLKALIGLRKAQPVLRQGSIEAPLLADEQVLVFHRRLGEQWALVALNNGNAERTLQVDLPAGAPATWRDPLDSAAAPTETAAGRITLRLPPLGGLVLLGR
jgi:cyclomaltodextrinase / maltogenic alpha-amylase / neopullulanase